MKYAILGFNQEAIVNYSVGGLRCDLTDLVLLDYLIYAQSDPGMTHILDGEQQPCVWLQHARVIEDLPILDITEATLRNHLVKLRKMGFLISKTVTNERSRGTKTYYRASSLLYEMTRGFQKDLISDQNSGSGTSRSTSDNKQIASCHRQQKKNNPKGLLSNVEFSESDESASKPAKKQSLYSRCASMVDDFILNDLPASENADAVKNALLEYLTFRLSVRDRPLYANMWKGMMNKLVTLSQSHSVMEVVQQSWERGYLSFYPPVTKASTHRSYGSRDRFSEGSGLKSDTYTQEELDQIMKNAEEREARGEQGVF